jgi:hypothetical protein
MIKVGVTGTRSGMNELQRKIVYNILSQTLSDHEQGEFHHGDCEGVDVEAAAMARQLGYKIICHPPEKDILRGYYESDETRTPLSYFARNRNIVDETSTLLVVPFQDSPQTNGGTWYTYDYAVKKLKRIDVAYPNGSLYSRSRLATQLFGDGPMEEIWIEGTYWP